MKDYRYIKKAPIYDIIDRYLSRNRDILLYFAVNFIESGPLESFAVFTLNKYLVAMDFFVSMKKKNTLLVKERPCQLMIKF